MDRTHERVLQAMAENLGEGLPRAIEWQRGTMRRLGLL